MLEIGELCIRLQCIVLPIHGWVAVLNMMCAGLGEARGALLLSTARQGTCFSPFVHLVCYLFKAVGAPSIQAIADVTGQEASKVIRAPGGNFPTEVWMNVEDLVTAEIGWDIDTEDWRQPGADAIATALKNATPGDVILMHDGGGDRSQTVKALKEALPYLREQGYSFITIDELMKYPKKDI